MRILTLILMLLFFTQVNAQLTVKAMTYNIRYDNPADGDNGWEKRRGPMSDLLRFYSPGIIGFQEVLNNQLEDLKTYLPAYKSFGAGRDDGATKGEYSPIFYDTTKYQGIAAGFFWLSPTPAEPSKGWDAAITRICTWMHLKDLATQQEFFVFNTHFDHKGAIARKESAILIIDKIRELNSPGLPTLLLGDLNATPDSDVYNTLNVGGLGDAFKLSQTKPYGPVGTSGGFTAQSIGTNRIDYIWSNNRTFKVTNYHCISDNLNGKLCSDHLPIIAEVTFK